MTRSTIFILIFMIVSVSLLSACARGSSADGTQPNVNDIFEFNDQGLAVLRGHVTSGSFTPSTNGNIRETIEIAVPADVEGMDASLVLPFKIRPETILSSSITDQTDAGEYLVFNPGSSSYNAFPPNALVDVTFRINEANLVAVSIKEVTSTFSLFSKKPTVHNVFSTDAFSQGTVRGRITQAVNRNNGSAIWTVAIPVTVQEIPAAVLLSFSSANDTKIITSNGTILYTPDLHFSWDNVQIQFTRRGDTLTAHEIKVLQ